MIGQIFTIVAPIIFISLLGYIWSYFKLRYDAQFIAKIVMDVGTPCLILSTMLKANLDSHELLHMSLVTVCGLALLFLLNAILLKLTHLSFRTYMSSLCFANTGNMGVPIALYAFGEQGLALALIIFMVTSLFHFSIGVAMVGAQHPLKTLLTSPVFYMTCIAYVFVFTGWELPLSILNTVELLGGMAIPLMIFSLGVSLQSLKSSSLKRSFFLGSARLVIGFAVGLILAWFFELEGMIRSIVIIQSAMPSAVFNYMLALNYNREKEEVAGVVVCSTILSFLTLPLLLWYVL